MLLNIAGWGLEAEVRLRENIAERLFELRWSFLRSFLHCGCIHINRSIVLREAGRVGFLTIVNVMSVFGIMLVSVLVAMVFSVSSRAV